MFPGPSQCPHPRVYACLDGVSGIKTPMLSAVAARRRTSAAATHTLRVDQARGIGSKGPLGRDFGGAARERISRGARVVAAVNVGPELGGAVEVINNLGLDTLTFLAATVLVIPAFKLIKASPVRILRPVGQTHVGCVSPVQWGTNYPSLVKTLEPISRALPCPFEKWGGFNLLRWAEDSTPVPHALFPRHGVGRFLGSCCLVWC